MPETHQRRLLASLAESGQQTPIVVVAVEGRPDRYVVIDGYKRIAALEQLGRDTVEAVVWPMSETAAVLLDRSLRLSERETALTPQRNRGLIPALATCQVSDKGPVRVPGRFESRRIFSW